MGAKLSLVVNFVGTQINGLGFIKEIARGVRSKLFLVSYEEELRAAKFFTTEHSHYAEREYQFGKDLRHPNLNYIEKIIEVEGFKGLLMPFMQGQKLSDYFDADLGLFLKHFKGLLEAIHYLHEQGILHRDIKPENVIIVQDKPRLFDFDLASFETSANVRTSIVGTIAYFSPEEIKGQPATKASDLYAAGIILYRALTGEVPFTGSIKELIKAHETRTPKAPSSFNENLSAFDAFLAKALHKNPSERFGSALELSRALDELIETTEVFP